MKIAVNTRMLLPHKLEGIGWFTYEVFKRLVQEHQEVEWLFVFDRPHHPDFIFAPNVKPRKMGPPARHPFLWYAWFEYSLPILLKQEQPDLLVSPDGFVPMHGSVPHLPVIHDINFHHHPEYVPWLAGKYYRHFIKKAAQKSTRVATVSQYSKEDIANSYGVPASKIDVVYNGVGDFFKPISEEEKWHQRQNYATGKPYFIFIGALNPRKNVKGMLKAYQRYRESGGEARFVIVGDKMFWSCELSQMYENHPYCQDIVFAGRMEGEDLNRILAAAQALLLVSHFEGFGIPVLEAFKSDVPVITATNSSMPEVAGDAALLCDSHDYGQIAESMRKTDHAEVCNRLIEKGRKRGREFSWEHSADMMWHSIDKTLGQ